MADIPMTPTAWMDLWLESQRRYVEAWGEMGRAAGAGGAAATRADPWSEAMHKGLDAWWQTVAVGLPAGTREAASRFLDVGKGYWRIGEAFQHLVEASRGFMGGDGEWQKALQEGLKRFQDTVCGTEAQANPWSGLATFCGMPLDNWRRVVSSLSVLPGDLEKALRGEGPAGPETLQRALDRLLATPPLGYTREWQEQVQDWAGLWLDHGQALQEYQSQLGSVTTRAVDKLGARLLERAKDGKPIETLREAYDLWVDCAEDAYAEVASSPGFISAQARLTNTLMAVKRHEQQIVAEVQSGLNMPTRREMDTSHRRVQELRREIRGLEDRLDELPRLYQEVEGLRAEIRALRADQDARRPAPAAAARPATSTSRRTRTKAEEGG
jgi:class III poly(R)-hydroxyalkanoic acid synthase PhaE subunit